jgi:predicted alpha-1,2-mannosidase
MPMSRVSALIASILMSATATVQAQYFTRSADPLVGTGGHGHCYPGATVPFGMVQLSPDNGTEGWDWCSGYNYGDSMIAGFSHMHLSGTGVGEWCDISVMPHTGLIPDTGKFFRVRYRHEDEIAEPGYYSVILANGVQASFSATERCGIHKYYFPSGCDPVLRFNLGFSINYDSTTGSGIKRLGDSLIVGYRYSTGWAHVQKVYFAASVSQKFKTLVLTDAGGAKSAGELNGHFVKGQLVFNNPLGKPVFLKVALSTVSQEKALAALREIKDYQFDEVRRAAKELWENELDKIAIKTDNDHLRRVFYSALYHTCMAPVLYSDADGTYRNAEDSVKKMPKGQRYTVFSLWDTFRGLNPLFTLTQQERNQDILNSMLAFFRETGKLPVWDLSTWETGCMSGYHAVPVMADAVLKNTPGVDPKAAYEAMKASAFQGIRGTLEYIKYGYVPQDKSGYSVTKTLEYAYDDWCIAQVARKLGKEDEYHTFMKRAAAYKLLFDKQTGFIRARNADGKFVEPFNPFYSSVDENVSGYEEGNAWQYTFFVPHDVRGLAGEFGGMDPFIKKLDALFTASSEVKGESAPPDMSGLIGQYIHGNEPSHHIAYMYDFVGEPWKTQEKIPFIIDSMYHDNPGAGYAGNEDCGQMSAWAVWSMMGLFPANPCGGEYVFGSPMFPEVVLHLTKHHMFTIVAHDCAPGNPYIQSVKLNGKPYTHVYIRHADIMKGGKLEFFMGSKPNKSFGTGKGDLPASANEERI